MNQEMNESEYQRLREQSWRRKLTAEEELRLDDYWSAQPEGESDREAEAGLTHLLSQLPAAPMASNFTAQVMRALDREVDAEARKNQPGVPFWRSFNRRAARIAWATLAATCVLLAYASFQYRQIRRAELAESVAKISTVAVTVRPEVFEDFEAIRRLSQIPADDSELLAALRSNN